MDTLEAGWIQKYSIREAETEVHPVDHFVKTRLDEKGLSSAPEADRRTGGDGFRHVCIAAQSHPRTSVGFVRGIGE